jgi:hypothetical protein
LPNAVEKVALLPPYNELPVAAEEARERLIEVYKA